MMVGYIRKSASVNLQLQPIRIQQTTTDHCQSGHNTLADRTKQYMLAFVDASAQHKRTAEKM